MSSSKTPIGERDRRITIQEKTITTNSFNEEVVTWSDLITVWAKVSEAQGDENYEADQLTERRLTVFDINHRSDVTVEHRIAYNDRYYDVVSIVEPDRKRSLKLKARLLDET